MTLQVVGELNTINEIYKIGLEAFVEKYGIKREELKKGIVDKVYNKQEKVER